MFRKFTKMLLICTLAVLSVCGCGSDGESSSNSGDNKYDISIDGVELKVNDNGEKCAIVELSFTNTGNKPISFTFVGSVKTFQNGIECNEVPVEYIDESTRDVQPGQSYTVHKAYYLNDSVSDMEVIVYDCIGFEEYLSKTFPLLEGEDTSVNKTYEDITNNSEQSQMELSSEQIYGELLSQYYTVLKNGVTADEFQEKIGSDLIFDYNMNLDLDSIGYALLDIDGNGIDELFIGCVQGGALTLEGTVTHGIFINAYSINTEENMIEPIACSNRSLYYYLCTDGLIGEYESHIPFSETYAFFELYRETELYSASGVITYNNEEGWYVVTEGNKEALTSAEADSLINSHIPMQINFTPFSGFQY